MILSKYLKEKNPKLPVDVVYWGHLLSKIPRNTKGTITRIIDDECYEIVWEDGAKNIYHVLGGVAMDLLTPEVSDG